MTSRSRAAQLIPALMVAAATAIPAATAVDILAHASASSSPVALGTVASSSSTLAGSAAASGAAAPSTTTAASSGTKTDVGTAEQNRFGTVQATLVVTGNTITSVSISAPQDNPRSASINAYAVPILISETLQAQSATINTVSGATYTSESYLASLQAALAAARL